MQLLAYNLRDLTGGSQGMSLPIPSWTGGYYNLPFYYVSLGILVVALLTAWWIRGSKYGLELLAIRDDEDRALGLGVRTGPAKLVAFVIAAFFFGAAGAMYAYFEESISPPFVFDANFDIAIALMGFMGGLGTLAGPILGAFIIEPAQQYFALEYGASGWYLVLYGVLFLLVILLLPEGILPTIRKRWVAFSATRGDSLDAKQAQSSGVEQAVEA
jgi:branched-chain amino acid transport system permease protein